MTEGLEASLSTALRERGHRVTPQRLAIAGIVCELDRHVTADHVFEELSRRMPGVSLPTVYATLELLEQLGLVRRVAAATGAVVYDSRTEAHHHLFCRRCGALADIEAHVDPGELLASARHAGFAADYAEVVVSGLCARCAR